MIGKMQEQTKRVLYGLLGMSALLGLDQLTKYLAVEKLKGRLSVPIISGVFELQYLENHGAAFGILQGKRLFLLAFTLLIFLILFVIYLRIPAGRHYLPMQFICIFIGAGALGNMVDRFIYGYVIDFFYFSLIDFPIFNVADCYVTVSCVLMLLYILFFYKEEDFSFLWRRKDKTDDSE